MSKTSVDGQLWLRLRLRVVSLILDGEEVGNVDGYEARERGDGLRYEREVVGARSDVRKRRDGEGRE